MRRNLTLLLTFLGTLILGSTAQAHFLWLDLIRAGSDGPVQVTVAFSEDGLPGEPYLLDGLRTMQIHVGDQVVQTRRGEDVLLADLGAELPTAAWFRYTYGFFGRGDEQFLLVYHGQIQSRSVTADEQAELVQEGLRLSLVGPPKSTESVVIATWKGEPIAGATITVAPDGEEPREVTTDGQGRAIIPEIRTGEAVLRTNYIEERQGQFEDQSYEQVRHWSTLTITRSR